MHCLPSVVIKSSKIHFFSLLNSIWKDLYDTNMDLIFLIVTQNTLKGVQNFDVCIDKRCYLWKKKQKQTNTNTYFTIKFHNIEKSSISYLENALGLNEVF